MEFIRDLLRGAAVGAANIIPGVSGGTLLVSMGVYPDIIHAVTGFFRHWKKSVWFLMPYAVGMILGIAGLSFAMEALFVQFPLQTALLFVGFIFGGLPVILKKISGRFLAAEGFAALCSFLLMIGIQFLGEGGERMLRTGFSGAATLFFLGIVGAATMVIPGVSGSMVLMSLGYYMPLLGRISQLFSALVHLDVHNAILSLGILIPFGSGVAVGAYLTAGLIDYFLKHHERMTYFVILGLLLSSPAAVFREIGTGTAGTGGIISGVFLFFIGVFAAWILEK